MPEAQNQDETWLDSDITNKLINSLQVVGKGWLAAFLSLSKRHKDLTFTRLLSTFNENEINSKDSVERFLHLIREQRYPPEELHQVFVKIRNDYAASVCVKYFGWTDKIQKKDPTVEKNTSFINPHDSIDLTYLGDLTDDPCFWYKLARSIIYRYPHQYTEYQARLKQWLSLLGYDELMKERNSTLESTLVILGSLRAECLKLSNIIDVFIKTHNDKALDLLFEYVIKSPKIGPLARQELLNMITG